MTGFDVYKLFLAVKLHFTTDNYDFFQYQGKVNTAKATYDKRKDKYFFDKLANKYNQEALIEYFVSQFVSQQNVWVGDIIKGEGERTYTSWKNKKRSLQDVFDIEFQNLLELISPPYEKNFDKLFQCSVGTHPIIIKSYLKKIISLETLTIINKIIPFLSDLDKKLTDPIWVTIRNKTIRYSPFLPINTMEYKKLIKNRIVT